MDEAASQPQYAGFVSRALAFLIDLVVMAVALLILIALAQSLLGFFTLYGVLGRRITDSGPFRAAVGAAIAVMGVGIAVGYPVGCWVMLGQTPGKALLGLRIVRVKGRPLTLKRALLRYLGYWLAALPLGLGFLWVLLDERRQGWHDKLAGTCVVYDARSTYRHRLPA